MSDVPPNGFFWRYPLVRWFLLVRLLSAVSALACCFVCTYGALRHLHGAALLGLSAVVAITTVVPAAYAVGERWFEVWRLCQGCFGDNEGECRLFNSVYVLPFRYTFGIPLCFTLLFMAVTVYTFIKLGYLAKLGMVL